MNERKLNISKPNNLVLVSMANVQKRVPKLVMKLTECLNMLLIDIANIYFSKNLE
jgi:hypothetical protein